MSLSELVDNTRTDKNTTHSYLNLYQELLVSKKNTAKNVLEIGIGDNVNNGGSILLWHDFFTQADIYALDTKHTNNISSVIKNNPRIHVYSSHDAYDENLFNSTFANTQFDLVLDDGPHTLESMKQCIRLYTKVLADDGILIIEDVQAMEWLDILRNEVPAHLQKYVYTYDLRKNKGRYDDIVFVVNKSCVQNE
jgi:hypothetical protein